MKIAIIYFSGTGNTLRVGEVFKTYLEGRQHKVDMVDISKKSEGMDEYDLYILGSPTYSKVSIEKLKEFFDKHIASEDNKSKDFITYITHSWSDAYGHITLKNHLEKLGYNVKSSAKFLMPNGFYMMNKEETSEKETIRRYKEVVNKVNNIMDEYFKGDIYIEEESSIKRIISENMYKVLNKTWIPSFAKKNIVVQEDKCILCKACVKNCPSNNISIVEDKITFSDHCLACAKCLNICPKNAFLANKKEFKQYNIRQKPILEQIK